MHRISEIIIKNFKSCIETKLKLEPFTALVGYNNAGKSNILKCIDILVRGKAQEQSSFYNKDEALEIIALVEGLNEISLGHLSDNQRESLVPYIEDNSIRIRFLQKKPGTSRNAVQMDVQKPSAENDNWNNPNGLPQAITTLFPEPTFINSMEDSAEDVFKVKAGNTIGKLILILQKQILETNIDVVNSALAEIGSKLNLDGNERLSEFHDFDAEITKKVADFFPGLKLNLDIPTPDISDLFKQGKLKVSEENSEHITNFSDMGHGAQRAIQMTLIRHLSEITKDTSKEGKTNLLLIDEPELFLHPQAIELLRASLKSLSKKGYQVVFTTHSPFMIEQEDIPYTNIVRKSSLGTRVEMRLNEAITKVLKDNIAQARLLFETYNLGQILFSDSVLIAEGETEKNVLPSLIKKVTGKSLGELKLALVVANGSQNIPGMIKILKEMNIPVKALADLDFAFSAYKFQLIEDGHPCIEKCLEIIGKLQPIHGFNLQGRYPTGGNGFKPAQVYELLAQDEQAKESIEGLINHFKNQSIWVWKLGAIEPHLCLEAKKTGEWYKFRKDLQDKEIEEVVHDPLIIKKFATWCTLPN
ncbi:AAA family ATPase [Acinetobacter sp. 194]|uniref:ATP-dependent nuclease n=1 Tax=Acinetobacter shaoyimingii TaxID=2715164 RepID=UPI00140808F4|nr:AAA family ATPase [Acinetobacter shaoyimingii]NHB58656.1 AAA family ATPase [Acinetobacter shaoyimingii]